MSLRNQPYLPLYIQDFLTDEKLSECSAATTGVFIRLMCLMHKSEHYGKILLKQKHKQTSKQVTNFALQVAKNLPYDMQTVEAALSELLAEKVLEIDGEYLVQKRMVKDNAKSEIRAKAGSVGGKKTSKHFAKAKAKAKIVANTEYENEYENENEDVTESAIEKMNKRMEAFKIEVFKHSHYGNEMLNDFFNYWTERKMNGTTMAFEKKPTFEISKRLITWSKNNFNKNNNGGTNTKISQQSGVELAEAIAKSAIEVNNRIARSKEQSANVSENNT